MKDTKTTAPAGADKILSEKEKAEHSRRLAQEEAGRKAQDLKEKSQFTEAFTSKGAAHGHF